MVFILHPSNVNRLTGVGGIIRNQIETRSSQILALTSGMTDPDISIVIRTRNDGHYLRQLFDDIRAQLFSGKVEIIVVDTESTDATIEYAKAEGATIIPVAQKDFTYPYALNLGFKAARYPYVLTLVGHSNLANRLTFKSLTYWCRYENFGGLYGFPIANLNGSIWDRIGCMWLPLILARPVILRRSSGSMMAANCSIVKREAWERLGGYDERYAGGGEDVALGRSMLSAGLMVVREPLMTVYHSHGLSFSNSVRQSLHWLRVGMKKPQGFNEVSIKARRPDLR